ncbi:MAG: glycine cleavage system protein H [Gemmatimonadota bacterium]|nr:MAG: glycine cleavage system protein H [Gemmatimonadota bacterium]
MESVATDIFATKGVEYLIVIAYLVVLVGFWKLLSVPREPTAARAQPDHSSGRRWLHLRDGYYFHQGHSWAQLEEGDVVRVGVDDFAMRLLGRPATVDLPEVGAHLRQGEPGWQFEVDAKFIPMLSPVEGEVTEVNWEVQLSPDLASDEPYDRGWLLKVRVPNARANLKNLLKGKLARAWIDEVLENLRRMRAGELGIVMPDGGIPVDGFARTLSPDRWDELARRFLLSD